MDHFLGFVYQELVHVPLIVKYPGQRDERRSDELVSQVDFVPTILDVVGTQPSTPLQGKSLLTPSLASERVVF
jgi:arylsulfatase A-like enzyme